MRRSFEGKRHQPAKSEEKRKRCDRKHRGFGFFCAFLLCAGLISGGAAVSGESGAQEAVNAEAPADDAVQPEVPAQPVEEAQQNTPAPEDTEGGGEAGQQQEETPDQQQEELYPEDDGNGEESVPSVSRPDAGSAESSAAPVGTTAEPLTVSVTTAMKYAFAGENVLTFETQITGGTEPFETSCEIDRDGTPVWSSQEYQPEVTYMPEEAGGYELVLSVTDAAGQAASGRCAIPVAVRHEESLSDWEPALKEVRMTGRYAEDLLAIARTQLGYTESADNFIVTEEGARQGYTRYGQWQGDAYEPWDAAFAAFCLYYAGVRDVPADTKAEKWADELKRRGMYRDLTAENRPEEGDFLFTRDGEVTRIGLVEKTDDTGVTAIEGDVGGAVARVTYGWDDARLAGFGDPRTTLTDEAAGVTVTGIFPEGATLTVQLLAEDADGFTEAQDRIHAALSPLYDRYAVNLADVTETAVYVPSLTVNGEVVSPCKKVRVGVSACGGRFAGHGDVRVLTFSDEQTELLSAEEKDGGDGADAIVSASFRTDRLSEFALTAVAPDRLTMRRTAADGDAKVTVTYGAGAGVPESAELRVRQIRGDGDDADRAEYQKRQAEATALLETEAGGENAASQPDTAASGSPGNAENADVSRQTDQNAENAAADQQADQNAENAAADQTEDSKEYAAYMEEVEAALASGRKVQMAKLFDITILDKEGNEVEPLTPVRANIEFVPKEVQEGTDLELYQFQTEGEKPQVMENVEVLTDDDNIVNGIEFETDGFSVYGIVGTETITTQVITASGKTYTIEVTYGPEAEIPEGSSMIVKEIIEGEEYEKYFSEAENALSDEDIQADISFARFFDIEIWNNGEKIEPKAAVQVKIINETALSIAQDESLSIVHFADSGTEIIGDVSLSEDGTTTVHEQSSFSVTGEIVGSFSGNNWPSVDAGNYVLIVNSGTGGPYYAVNSDGSLTEVEYDTETGNVTFLDAASTDDLNSYLWTYYVNGGNHRLTSVTNTNNKIYPVQTQGGSAISNSTSSPAAEQGYIRRGTGNNKYCVAINDAGTSLISSRVTFNSWSGSYTFPSNAAHFQFATNFEVDVDGAYGTASSIILTGNSKTLRMAEVTTDDEELIDFEGFSWRSSNTSIVTVSTNPDTDAPIATGVAVGTARIVGTRVNEHGETDEVIWTVTVKDKTGNSIVFLHQPQDNENFANQDNFRPHDGYGNTEPTNYVKFVVALADEDGNILLYNGKPDVELPEGSVVPDRYEFELDSTGVFAIEEDTLSGISVPGYSYAGTYAYFGWYNNTDLENMAVVSEFKNLGAISTRYPNYYSVLGFKTSRGNPQYQDYAQTTFGESGYGYYAYNPTGVLMIVLQPVSEDIAYRTSYHNDYVPGGTAVTNIVDTTRAKMTRGEWIADQYRWDWYGETIMTEKTADDLVAPADGYEFVGWFDSVDSEGNGTGNQIVGQTEDGYFFAMKDGERIVIRQNNDIYAKWQLVRGTLRIEKEISGNLSDAEMESLKSALTFTVTDDNTQETIIKTGADMTWTGNKGSVDIMGLSAATTYTVTEANADITNYDVTTEIVGGTNVKVSKTGAKTVSVTNTYVKKVATIKVIKMESGSSKKLPNAAFNLYRPATEDDTEPVTIKINGTDTSVVKVQTITVGDDGEVEVPDLPVGSYYLVETTPPVGYELLSTVIGFDLSSDSINLRSSDHVRADGLELTVYNDSGVTLPNTGGSGTLPYTLCGIALIMASALMYGFRMRRRERRLN